MCRYADVLKKLCFFLWIRKKKGLTYLLSRWLRTLEIMGGAEGEKRPAASHNEFSILCFSRGLTGQKKYDRSKRLNQL